MPDKWEYPWYAAWDLAFHSIAAGAGRPRLRQGAARAAPARVVHAPERPAPRLRVGVRRRQPAGARLGRAGASTRSRSGCAAAADRRVPRARFHKLLLNFTWWVNRKDAEGKNVFQGGFLGLDNIGVFDRSRAAADRRAPRAVRRHRLDGDVLPEHAGDRARARRATTRPTRTSRPSSSSTSSTSPHAMNDIGGEGHRALGRGGRVLLRRAPPAGRPAHAAEGPLAGRADAALRRRDARRRDRSTACRVRAPDALVPREPAGPARPRRVHASAGATGSRAGSCRS